MLTHAKMSQPESTGERRKQEETEEKWTLKDEN